MNRDGRAMRSILSRRQFLARQGLAAGGLAITWLLQEERLFANSAAKGVAFPLKISENHRYLEDSQGRPFFLLGDTPWFLQKLLLEDVRRVLEDRKAKGFNTLFLEVR